MTGDFIINMDNKIFTKEEREEWTKKLQPYWNEFWKVQNEFVKKTAEIEKKMNSKIKPFVQLGFFWCDGECVGIGAEDIDDRSKFPLLNLDIPDEENPIRKK